MNRPLETGDILRNMGYHGQTLAGNLLERVDSIKERVETETRPRGIFEIYPIDIPVDCIDGSAVSVMGTSLKLPGKAIRDHLNGASACALLACTLGAGCDRELQRLAAVSPLDQTIYDAACSALIEQAVDELQAHAVAYASAEGLFANNRFSPGYGDLPLSVQPKFLDVLQAQRRIGLMTTDRSLLVPTKSVTALIGLFDTPQPDAGSGCTVCSMKDSCPMRHEGSGGCGTPLWMQDTGGDRRERREGNHG